MCFKAPAKTPEAVAQEAKNKEIENDIKVAKKTNAAKIRLLLLGTGDAGKSTFAKQMKVLHRDGFNDAEKDKFVSILRDNCITAMQKLIGACKEWNIELEDKAGAETVRNANELNVDVAKAIQALFKTKGIMKAFERENEIQLPGGSSGAEYYFNEALRFAESKFVPTTEDVIRAKMRTTGIAETIFTVNSTEFTMVDVGGQRSERRKWLNCFVDVGAVIFLVALNEYDMLLEEDNKTNRMEESLKLFQKLSGSQWFNDTSFILFLNKSDLFAEKIKKRPLKDYFEDYETFEANLAQPGDEFENSCMYIRMQYSDAFAGNRLYPFVTCAIDKTNCEKVFASVRDTVITSALAGAGI